MRDIKPKLLQPDQRTRVIPLLVEQTVKLTKVARQRLSLSARVELVAAPEYVSSGTQVLPGKLHNAIDVPNPANVDATRIVRSPLIRAESAQHRDVGHAAHGRITLGSVLKNRFELIELLGAGGMGIVYKAKDLRHSELGEQDPWVAVKVLSDDLAKEDFAVAALQQECRRCQKLAHPNIATVHDFDRAGDLVFMTMECLSGQALEDIVQNSQFNGMSLEKLRPWLNDVAEALIYAHRQGIVHSDLKPSNIFITHEGHAKVFDFGIARAMQTRCEAEQSRHLVAYTPAYASLAMLQGAPPDPADDAYALACVVYVLLTGRHPYRRKSADQVVSERLTANRIEALSRSQWRVLQRLLNPASVSSLGVSELRMALCHEPARRVWLKWFLPLSFLAASAVFFTDQASHWERNQVVEQLTSGQTEAVAAGFAAVAALSGVDKSWVLDAARDSLLEFLVIRTGQNHQRLSDPELDNLLLFAAQYYPDSMQIIQLSQAYHADRQQRVVALSEQIEGILQDNKAIVAEDALELERVWQQLAAMSPDHFLSQQKNYLEAVARRANLALYAGRIDVARWLLQAAQSSLLEPEHLAGIAASLRRYEALDPAQVISTAPAMVLREHHLDELRALQQRVNNDTEEFGILWPDLLGLYSEVDVALGQAVEQAFIQQTRVALQIAQEQKHTVNVAALRALGQVLAPHDPVFQVPRIRRDPCHMGLAGRGELSQSQCRDVLFAAQMGPSLAVIPVQRGAPAYAVSVNEISVAEYNLYCRFTRQCDQRSEAIDLPITGLSIGEVRAYIQWLSERSGWQYVLPDKAHWQQAVEATGQRVLADHNCRIEHAGRLIRGGRPRPVSEGSQNPWGLRNGLGNVAEWVDHQGKLLLMGGDFRLPLSQCQSHTYQIDRGDPGGHKGFRVMRFLDRAYRAD